MKDDMEKGVSGLTVRVVEVDENSHRRPQAWKRRLHALLSIFRRSLNRRDISESPWPKLVRRALYLLTAVTGLLAIAFMYARLYNPSSKSS